jgi:hypothetical protein
LFVSNLGFCVSSHFFPKDLKVLLKGFGLKFSCIPSILSMGANA